MRFCIPTIFAAAIAITLPVQADLRLQDAVAEAIHSDHWARSNNFQEQALRSQALASGQLPDPKLRLALANLPTDTFDFDQENMTQLQVGLSQQFPRGDSLKIRQQQLGQQADKGPIQRRLRAAKLKQQVSNRWLKLHALQEQLMLLENNRHLFQELVDISRANFRSGKARRFEVIDAELQITRLNDRITRMQQQDAVLRGQLNRWLPQAMSAESLPISLPEIKPLLALDNVSALQSAVQSHPQLQLLAQDVEIRQRGIELADQAYRPGFRLDTSYGLRDDMPNGRDRADFFSVALTFDLPLFPEKRQDAKRNAAVQQREAAREDRLLSLREYEAELHQAISNYRGLQQRLAIYNQDYLRQLREKRIAAIRSYAAADGRFSDVAAAAMGELETKLMKVQLEHQQAQMITNMNYWLAGADPLLMANEGEVNP
ncbi:TolC family protein [Pontibacterium sp. N1Y112]|uniref:TolC family protein n=1 Tax=Pontibacterium sinense TaxID=2781979 RepID=A0A8J7FQX7_9GAMM|nr:TolC family protein [Pontibacterium sinense]MBE9395745.1 TolC family protein [Pontibacterium sinense]